MRAARTSTWGPIGGGAAHVCEPPSPQPETWCSQTRGGVLNTRVSEREALHLDCLGFGQVDHSEGRANFSRCGRASWPGSTAQPSAASRSWRAMTRGCVPGCASSLASSHAGGYRRAHAEPPRRGLADQPQAGVARLARGGPARPAAPPQAPAPRGLHGPRERSACRAPRPCVGV
jgi:hypothetical protein